MAQQTFGNRLAEARRRRGLTLDQVHAQLRISPAILEALETEDFRHMPLKGHARNMVSSYARYLGLDSQEVTRQFLSEYHDYENREARRGSSAPLGLGLSSASSSRSESAPLPSHQPGGKAGGKALEGRGNRSMWDRPIPSSELNRGYDSRSMSAQRVANAASRRSVRTFDAGSSRGRDRGGASTSNNSYTARVSLPMRIFGALFRSPAVLVIVLIVVLVALLVGWAVLANSCKAQQNEIIPVTTGSVVEEDSNGTPTDGDEGTGGAANGELSDVPDPNAGPFELTVTPAEGQAPWTEVTVDGEEVCREGLSESKTWTVNESCSIMTAQPGNLTVTRNGEEVELEINTESGSASIELEVTQTQEDQEEGENGEG